MSEGTQPLVDRTAVWLGVGGVIATLSAAPLAVGAAQRVGNKSLWINGWFVLGALGVAVGVVAVLWALVLLVAHAYADRDIRVDIAEPAVPPADGRPAIERAVPIIGKVFRNERVVVTGHVFTDCEFYNVTFVIEEGDHYTGFSHCTFGQFDLEVTRSAQLAVRLMIGAGLLRVVDEKGDRMIFHPIEDDGHEP